MTLPSDPAERHRAIAAAFSDRVGRVTDWDAPTPVAEWVTRDVVRHLVEWFPAFLAGGTGITLAQGPSVDEDPGAAWEAHASGVQDLLDDPAYADHVLSNPHTGDVLVPQAVDRFYTSDVFMHTWDLARGAGLEDRLDPDECAQMLAGMEPLADLLAGSGEYGERVAVPDDADAQTKLLGLIGRNPFWTP